MKTLLQSAYLAILGLCSAPPAFAHVGAGPHGHPHGAAAAFTGLEGAVLLLAVLACAAGFALFRQLAGQLGRRVP